MAVVNRKGAMMLSTGVTQDCFMMKRSDAPPAVDYERRLQEVDMYFLHGDNKIRCHFNVVIEFFLTP